MPQGPRHSPLWFIWEDGCAYLIGSSGESFTKRLIAEPRFRRLLAKYLGPVKAARNPCFIENIACIGDFEGRMVRVVPETIVAKDVSCFKTGPELARP